jgi:hypothetical protein
MIVVSEKFSKLEKIDQSDGESNEMVSGKIIE